MSFHCPKAAGSSQHKSTTSRALIHQERLSKLAQNQTADPHSFRHRSCWKRTAETIKKKGESAKCPQAETAWTSSCLAPQVYVWFLACWCIFSSASSWWTFFLFSPPHPHPPPTLFFVQKVRNFVADICQELENSQNYIQLEQPPWGSHNSTQCKLLTIQAKPWRIWQLLFKQHFDSHHNNLLCIFKHPL